nr:MAG TPA: hypothetical protein [Caudoviricetes sp.]
MPINVSDLFSQLEGNPVPRFYMGRIKAGVKFT